MRRILVWVTILLILVSLSAVFDKAQEDYVTLETKYFIFKAPREEMKYIRGREELFDKIYEIYLELVGTAPYGRRKIVVEYRAGTTQSVANVGWGKMEIAKQDWEDPEFPYRIFAHELGHLFTLFTDTWQLIVPSIVNGEGYEGIVEGWANFMIDFVWLHFGKKENYLRCKKFCLKELQKYEEKLKDFRVLRKNQAVWIAMLEVYVDTYGINSLKRFFRLATNIDEIPFPISYITAFTYLMARASGREAEVYEMFRKRWYFPVPPYREDLFYIVNVSCNIPTSLFIDGQVVELAEGEEVSLLLPGGKVYEISVMPEVTISEGERWYCEENSVKVESNVQLEFKYEPQYRLKIVSRVSLEQLGIMKEEEWYAPGTELVITIPQVITFEENGTRFVFQGFYEGEKLLATENHLLLTMDRPREILVQWEKEYKIVAKSAYGEVRGTGWYKEGEMATLSISPATIEYGNKTKRVLSGWCVDGELLEKEETISLKIEKPMTIKTKWSTYYYIEVISERGSVTGAGWYERGTRAKVSITPTVIEENLFVRWKFIGWEVKREIVSLLPEYSLIVEKPTTLRAVWEREINFPMLVAIITLIASIVAGLIYYKKHS